MALCQICETRKARRYCPGVRGEICPQCCGTERERTVDCPLDCDYLIESRRHGKPGEIDPKDIPNPDVQVSEDFLQAHEALVTLLAQATAQAVANGPGAIDYDVREAYAAITRTYKTLESGLIYETKPANPYAEGIRQHLHATIEDLKKRIYESTGMHSLRDSDVFKGLVFLQRLEVQMNNGRPRGRAFISFLVGTFPGMPPIDSPSGGPEPSDPSPIIIP